jgi:hypothetical protein
VVFDLFAQTLAAVGLQAISIEKRAAVARAMRFLRGRYERSAAAIESLSGLPLARPSSLPCLRCARVESFSACRVSRGSRSLQRPKDDRTYSTSYTDRGRDSARRDSCALVPRRDRRSCGGGGQKIARPLRCARAMLLAVPVQSVPSRTELLEARVATLSHLVLSLTCYEGCEFRTLLPLHTIQRSHGHLQLQAVVKRLKCSRCKRPPARATVVDHVVDDLIPTFRVEIMP